jgi:hypothetical protein
MQNNNSEIRDDDPELAEVLRVLGRPIYSVNEILESGPYKRTRIYQDINSGRLVTFLAGTRRFSLAPDYAKYLLLLKREGTADSVGSEARSEEARNRQRSAIRASNARRRT